MLKLPFVLLFVFVSLLFHRCDSEPGEPQKTINKVTYTESAEDFPNPERGLYHYTESRACSPHALSETQLKNYRNTHKPGCGSYNMVRTLIFRYYVLDNFTDAAISEAFLNVVAEEFAIAR